MLIATHEYKGNAGSSIRGYRLEQTQQRIHGLNGLLRLSEWLSLNGLRGESAAAAGAETSTHASSR